MPTPGALVEGAAEGRQCGSTSRAARRKDWGRLEGYRDLLALQPDNALVLNNGVALSQQNDPAALGCRKGLRVGAQQPGDADTLGWMLVDGDASVARSTRERRGGAGRQIRMHYAKALLKTGDKAGARKELEAVSAAPGESPLKAEAAELLKKL
jgi:hypothetical protein